MNGFLVRSVLSVICMAGVSGLIAEEEVSSPMSKQTDSQLVNSWDNPEKFRELLKENIESILQSKYIKENTYCPELLDEIINNKIEYLKPVEKLDSNDALKIYIENKYGCKDFSLDYPMS